MASAAGSVVPRAVTGSRSHRERERRLRGAASGVRAALVDAGACGGRVGGGRGAVWVDEIKHECMPDGTVREVVTGGYWKQTGGLQAALSDTADNVKLWPADVRAAGKATYEALKKFKEKCPCHCPGPDDSRKPTSSGDAADDKKVNDYLDGKFPGPNLPRP